MVYKVAVVGDSIVYGRVDLVMGGWVYRLRRWLESIDPTGYAVYNLGIGGETTKSLLERIEFEVKVRGVNLTMIMVGVNDSRINNGREEVPLNNFIENLRRIFKVVSKLSNVIYITMFPIDETKTKPYKSYYYSLLRLKRYATSSIEVAEELGICYIDIFNRVINTFYRELLYDGLHPNSKGHELIFKTVREYIENHGIIPI